MASVQIKIITESGMALIEERSANEYDLHDAETGDVIETPFVDMLFATAIAKVVRVEGLNARSLLDRVAALLEQDDG